FLFSGLSAKLRTFAKGKERSWFLSFAIYFLGFWTFLYVLDLPLHYLAGFMREHAYGLSDQTLAKWAGDNVKGFFIGAVICLVSLWVPYGLLRRAPRTWWLITGAMAVPYFFFLLLVTPIWIEPLFNHFGELQNKGLEQKIVRLAERAGIDAGKVYE